MAGDREVLLDLVELVEIDHRDRVLLAVDHLLREREIKLRERDRLHDGAERLHRGLDLQFGRGAQFQSLDVVGRVDRAHAVGHVAKAVVPVAQQDETLLLGERGEPIHRRPVEHPVDVGGAVEHEREHHGGEREVVFIQLPLRRQPHVDGAELDLLGLLRRPAQHVVGKDVDFDRAVRARLDPARELLGGDVRRMIFLGEMRPAQRQRRRRARHIGSRQAQPGKAGAGGLEERSAIHGFLLG